MEKMKMTDANPVTTVKVEGLMKSKLASRKFLVTTAMFFGSVLVTFAKPELLGDGNIQTLFNFWTMLAAVFFGGNIGEHMVNGKNK